MIIIIIKQPRGVKSRELRASEVYWHFKSLPPDAARTILEGNKIQEKHTATVMCPALGSGGDRESFTWWEGGLFPLPRLNNMSLANAGTIAINTILKGRLSLSKYAPAHSQKTGLSRACQRASRIHPKTYKGSDPSNPLAGEASRKLKKQLQNTGLVGSQRPRIRRAGTLRHQVEASGSGWERRPRRTRQRASKPRVESARGPAIWFSDPG